jgi:hypothetical protein
MAMLDAMACGKPLLIADSSESASTDFVSDDGRLFKARKPEDLAAQLEPITSSMKNGSRCQAAGCVGRMRLTTFSFLQRQAPVLEASLGLTPRWLWEAMS